MKEFYLCKSRERNIEHNNDYNVEHILTHRDDIYEFMKTATKRISNNASCL